MRNDLYAMRTWLPKRKQNRFDPIRYGEEVQVPIEHARAKVLGPTHEDAMISLAAKIWLIENAKHTIDATYYIFKRDPVGYALLGALSNAVKRGVDVRIMADSLGSFHPGHSELRAPETCAGEAGFMRNAEGDLTTNKARVQPVIFNAITKFNFNRRSHDKLLVVDGQFPAAAAVMTGGRNISLDYYGITKGGSPDPGAFRDLEILLRPGNPEDGGMTVGAVSEAYYTLLFLHHGNKRIRPLAGAKEGSFFDLYAHERNKGQHYLAFLKGLPEIQARLADMPRYMSEGFHDSEVRLAHQLGNLTASNVTTRTKENIDRNPNSILYLINKITAQAKEEEELSGTLRIVSPYLFIGQYYDKAGNLVYDGAQDIRALLRDHPNLRIEVITNSALTSDNFFTQAIIDMEMVPRVLLTPELQKAWRSGLKHGEFNPAVVESGEWRKLADHPQLFIYETGKLDSIEIGKGTTYYGKLHAKYIVGNERGFIGTSNFDYRSNLYNNEMGFFCRGEGLRDDLVRIFELLKGTSYRWGSPEWLQMRRELMPSDSKKAFALRIQRGVYKTIRCLGLEYLM